MPDNENPTIFTQAGASSSRLRRTAFLSEDDDAWLALDSQVLSDGCGSSQSDEEEDIIDSAEIFDLIRSITDPEHPLTLEQLAVVSKDQIRVTYPEREKQGNPHVLLEFTPTIPHCSMATLIGLTLRVRLLRSLPSRFKVDIKVKEGSHQSERAVNKQLNDKERVAAALENTHLLDVVQQCLATAGRRGKEA